MSCLLPYQALHRRLVAAAPDQRLPIGGSLELTTRCNLACRHCYISLATGLDGAGAPELDTAQWRRLLDELAAAGCLWLLFTGGEPLLRPDFAALYRHAKLAGFFVTVFTNGTLLDEPVADLLAELPPFGLELSLYGPDAATYGSMTGRPEAFYAARAALDRLSQRGVPVTLKAVLTRDNWHTLPQLQELAARRGLALRLDAELNAAADGGRAPLACRLAPAQVVALDALLPERRAALVEQRRRFADVIPQGDRLYQCDAGRTIFNLDPRGRLQPCLLDRQPGPDAVALGFAAAWRALASLVDVRWTADVPCRQCTLFGLCSQCPGMARMEHGDPQAPVAYFCAVAHERAALVARAPTGAPPAGGEVDHEREERA